MKKVKFIHNGSLGDIIYCLPTIISFKKGILYLTKENQYNILKKLLNIQPYIQKSQHISKLNNNVIDIDLRIYRKTEVYYRKKGDTKHLTLCHLIPFKKKYDITKKWLYNIKKKYLADIIINRSPRYHDKEEINWNLIKEYQKYITFIGTEKEYKYFKKIVNFDLPYYYCKDGLEFAQIIKGSRLYIGNQSFGFSLAEAMKKPRVLEVYYTMNNCQPHGKNGYTFLTKKIINKYLNK